MSEYQYIAFRAIDGPVTPEDLDFMRDQSTRAEITPWTFDNVYHFGDFHGDTFKMLRRGYDFHFHYANFGIRTLMFRFPDGLPDRKAAKPYLEKRSLEFRKDRSGPGGILCIEPYYEPDELEELWNFEDLLDLLPLLRNEILDGDLRPLYLASLAILRDSNHGPAEEAEPPVPAGLRKLTEPQSALAEFYGLSDALIETAAEQSPQLPRRRKPGSQYAAWLKKQPVARKNEWLAKLMDDPDSGVRRELMNEYRQSVGTTLWPTTISTRTVGELLQKAGEFSE